MVEKEKRRLTELLKKSNEVMKNMKNMKYKSFEEIETIEDIEASNHLTLICTKGSRANDPDRSRWNNTASQCVLQPTP